MAFVAAEVALVDAVDDVDADVGAGESPDYANETSDRYHHRDAAAHFHLSPSFVASPAVDWSRSSACYNYCSFYYRYLKRLQVLLMSC